MGSGGIGPQILTLAYERSASHPTANLNAVARIRNPFPTPIGNQTPVIHPVTCMPYSVRHSYHCCGPRSLVGMFWYILLLLCSNILGSNGITGFGFYYLQTKKQSI